MHLAELNFKDELNVTTRAQEILGPKHNSSTKIIKKQNKKKVRATIAKFKRGETVNDDKERDYVDIFVRAAIAKFKRGETVNDDKERDYVDIF
ncbi:7745_t:CDS:2, partial [Gigaspora margarita]